MEEITVDLIPEGDGGKFHLLNSPNEEFRSILARTKNQASPLNMKIKIVEIHHGEMKLDEGDCLATLLVLEFRFQSQLQEHRYKTASVSLEFADKDGIVKRDPTVYQIAPDRVKWMNKTEYDKTTKFGVSFGVTGGVEVANSNVDVHWDVEHTQPLRFKATLTGFSSRSPKRYYDGENIVTWTMQENPNEGDGIPSFLQTAVLLKRSHDVPFSVDLRVKSDVNLASMARRILHFKEDGDRMIEPITITPSHIQVRGSSVTRMREGDLRQMNRLPVSGYFRVNISEDDLVINSLPVAIGISENEDAPPPPSITPQSSVTMGQPLLTEIASTLVQPIPEVPRAASAASVAASAARAAAKAARAAAEAAEAAALAAEIAAERLQ